MGRAAQTARPAQVSQYYHGYLADAVAIFERAIAQLKHCEDSQCEVADATDMAHRIKGNAAMYGYADLGLSAEKTERELRGLASADCTATALLSLITLVDQIHDVCENTTQAEPTWLRDALAVEAAPPPGPSQAAAPEAPLFNQDQPCFDRKSVIIAYQDPWLCELMGSMLTPQFEVIACHSAAQVYAALAKGTPDLLVTENALGDMSGISLLRDLRHSPLYTRLPVFIAFDPGSTSDMAEAISAGADGFAQDKHEVLEVVEFIRQHLDKPAPRALIVDDDPVVRDLLTHALESAGLIVDIAEDGLEALAYLSETTPDIVLLDRFMPRLEGGTVLYEIQNKINLKSIPVLILTAMVNRGEAKAWFERGAADFIPKPFDPEEVLMRVKQHLETRQISA